MIQAKSLLLAALKEGVDATASRKMEALLHLANLHAEQAHATQEQDQPDQPQYAGLSADGHLCVCDSLHAFMYGYVHTHTHT